MLWELRCKHQDAVFFPIWLLFQCVKHRRKAVVVRRAFGLGDVVCVFPLCDEIRRRHPKTLLVFVTSQYAKPLVLLSKKADVVFGAYGVQWRVPRLCGLVAAVYDPKTSEEMSPKSGSQNHLVDALAISCGITLRDRQPRFTVPDAILENVRKKFGLQKKRTSNSLIIGINCGRSWPVKEWSASKWQGLVDKIHSAYDADILQFGQRQGNSGDDEFDKILGVRSVVSSLQVEELAGLIAVCDLVVTIDSAPLHIAGAVGVPVVGVFGPVGNLPPDSAALGVVAEVPCRFCHHRTPIAHWQIGCPHDIRCMKELKVDAVFTAVQSLLANRNRPQLVSDKSKK
jgi:ADP-heptose:LPS heptosyltransferase